MAAGSRHHTILQDLREAPGATPAFVLIHVGCLLVVLTGTPWDAVAVGAITYVLRGLGISAGYHRYFSHRSFKTSRVFQLLLAVLGTMAVQKGVLWWVAHHRRHHQVADRQDDLHSPGRQGFWWAHIGWFLARGNEATDWSRVRDLVRYPELVWLNEHFAIPPLILAVLLYLAGGLPWLVWGFFVSSTLALHVTCAINSITHRHGSRPYETPDDSRNNAWLALPSLGESWHNNHHHFAHAARIGWRWWQIDATYCALVLLTWLGITWDPVQPDARIVRAPTQRAAAVPRA